MAYFAGVRVSVNGGPEQDDLNNVTLRIGDSVEVTGKAYETSVVTWEAQGLLEGSGQEPVADNNDFKITDTVSSQWEVNECSGERHYKLWPGEKGASNYVLIEGEICPEGGRNMACIKSCEAIKCPETAESNVCVRMTITAEESGSYILYANGEPLMPLQLDEGSNTVVIDPRMEAEEITFQMEGSECKCTVGMTPKKDNTKYYVLGGITVLATIAGALAVRR